MPNFNRDNPECERGSHANCSGLTWDDETDAEAACPCFCHSDDMAARIDTFWAAWHSTELLEVAA